MAVLESSNLSVADLALLAGKLDDDDTVTDEDYEATLISPTSSGGLTE